MSVEMSDAGDAPWERAVTALRARVERWIAAESGRTMNGLARDLGYSSPNGLRKALMSGDGPRLSLLLRLASELGCHSIEELFGDAPTTSWIEEMRGPG